MNAGEGASVGLKGGMMLAEVSALLPDLAAACLATIVHSTGSVHCRHGNVYKLEQYYKHTNSFLAVIS